MAAPLKPGFVVLSGISFRLQNRIAGLHCLNQVGTGARIIPGGPLAAGCEILKYLALLLWCAAGRWLR